MEINNDQFKRMQELEDIRVHNELYPSTEAKYQEPKPRELSFREREDIRLKNESEELKEFGRILTYSQNR